MQLLQIGGALMILAAYGLAQAGALDQRSYPYLLLNLIGSAILAVLALLAFQWGFVLLEVAWVGISLAGLMNRSKRGRR